MKTFFTLLTLCLSIAVLAQEEATRRRNFNTEHGLALREFDPVSYFKNNPAKGNSKLNHTHKGITYYFVSEANMQEFIKSPDKYEPAYGGWCAYSMGVNGEKVKINPATYKIIGGKVYLFHNFNNNNHLIKWNKEEKKLKSSADYYWRKKIG